MWPASPEIISQANLPSLRCFDQVFVSAMRTVTTIPVLTKNLYRDVPKDVPTYTETILKIYIATKLIKFYFFTWIVELKFLNNMMPCFCVWIISSVFLWDNLPVAWYFFIELFISHCISILPLSQLLGKILPISLYSHFTGSKTSNRKAPKHSINQKLIKKKERKKNLGWYTDSNYLNLPLLCSSFTLIMSCRRKGH